MVWACREDGIEKTSENNFECRDASKKARRKIENKVEGSGLSLEEAATEARDRDRWRTIVQASCGYNATGS